MLAQKKVLIIIFFVLSLLSVNLTIAFTEEHSSRVGHVWGAIDNIREEVKATPTDETNIRTRFSMLKKWIPKLVMEQGYDVGNIIPRKTMIGIQKMINKGEIKGAARIIDDIYSSLEKLLTEKEKKLFKRTLPSPKRIAVASDEHLDLLVKNSMIGVHGSVIGPWQHAMKRSLKENKEVVTSTINRLRSLGVHWLRPGTICGPGWSEVEPEEGKFDFSKLDFVLEKAAENGMNVVGAHISSFVRWDNPFQFRNKQRIYKKRAHFIRYVKTVVERYDGDIEFGVKETDHAYPKCDFNGNGKFEDQEKKEWADNHKILYWEVLNEPILFFNGPPDDYFEIIRTAYKTIKEIASQCRVLNAAPTDLPSQKEENFFTEWIKRGGYDYFDILNLHIYSFDTTKLINQYKTILTTYCPACADREIWVTETGAPSWHRIGRASPERQASEVVKRYVLAFANGVSKLFWHRIDDGPIIGKREVDDFSKFGLFDYPERKPKPSYFALKLLLEKIDSFSSVETLQTEENEKDEIFLFRFEKNSNSIYVMWSTSPLKYHFKTEQHLIITQINGNKKEEQPNNKIVLLNVTETPIFIEYVQ